MDNYEQNVCHEKAKMHGVSSKMNVAKFMVNITLFLDTQVSLEPTHVLYNLAEPNVTLLNRI